MRAKLLGGACATALVMMGASTKAAAQDVGYQLNRLDPAPAGDGFAVVEAPWYTATRRFSLRLLFDHSQGVLGAVDSAAPVDTQDYARLDVSLALAEFLGIDASLPLVVHEAGTPFAGVGPTDSPLVGDPRLGARLRLTSWAHHTILLSATGAVWIPVGATSTHAGDAHLRILPRLVLAGPIGEHVRFALNGGLLLRDTAQLAEGIDPVGNTVGSEWQGAAAVDLVVAGGRVALGPELTYARSRFEVPEGQKRDQAELFGHVRVGLGGGFELAAGVGVGLAGAPEPPGLRFLFSVAYAPVATTVRRLSRFERVVVVPDEDGHVGAVEVDDGKSKTLLDKAYATSEIAQDQPHVHEVKRPPEEIEKETGELTRNLPPPDRDLDGVPDKLDACPERAGAPSPDPLRAGCPAAPEKVVVLPDEDGHVGGVEVDDGQHVVVLDKPYATAEVGPSGAAKEVPPPPPKVLAAGLAQVAAALPPRDRDDDGVADGADACPDRAGPTNADPVRTGCPAVEKVVVLPDADGHVGGVEVDDGSSVTVLDSAYASAEVGADGKAHAVPPAAPASIEHSVAQVARSLPPADADGDGVRDDLDACPDRAGVASADPVRAGCPRASEKVVVVPDADGHVGGVEVDDGKSTVVLDQPFASSEVGPDGRAQLVPPASGYATLRSIERVARALPIADRDDDGVPDGEDACRDRAGVARGGDPARNGCPRAAEKVVVLPDPDGHVGGVEVELNGTTTVVSSAYGSVEVGADGGVLAVPADPADVGQEFAPALAAQPPGARMFIYFDNRAQPVRDITAPVASIVAEVQGKSNYTIDVVGHTDQTGRAKKNYQIGLERAQLIANGLIAAGVPADRIRVTSKGDTEPVAKVKSKRTVELRNRRVEVFVTYTKP